MTKMLSLEEFLNTAITQYNECDIPDKEESLSIIRALKTLTNLTEFGNIEISIISEEKE